MADAAIIRSGVGVLESPLYICGCHMGGSLQCSKLSMHFYLKASYGKALDINQTFVICIKQEAALQKEADSTLFEVRSKKKDADKTLEMLRALRKLRNVRKEAAARKGLSKMSHMLQGP